MGEVGEEVGEAVGRGGRRAGEGAAGEGATLPGSLYVPKELVDIYRDEVLPLASVLTPNQFEAEQLTQRPIRSEADAVAACEALHARGPRTVFLTSIDLPAGGAAGEAAGGVGPQRVMMLASTRDDDGVLKQWRLRLPRLDQVPRARTRASVSARARARARAGGGGEGAGAGCGCGRGMQGHAHAMDGCATLADPRGPSGYVCMPQDFTGTGDLVAALLLAWSDRLPGAANLPLVLEKAGATVQAVLQRTHASGRRELCLVPPRPKKCRRSKGRRRAAQPLARPRARAARAEASSVPPRGGGVPILALRPSPVRLRHAQVQSQAELLEPQVRVRAEALQ